MSDPIIEVKDVSKRYKLGQTGSGSLRQDIKQSLLKSVNKEDRFFRNTGNGLPQEIWALRDINLQVEEGTILGIVGPNGAGKSTLLKIMCRITRPTKGIIRGRGKISSLLEIGTGFHHELSGRENIFISGYMLGMKRNEIRQRFDEIVEFSGVSEFLDTPVKRYSSGMYLKLAFAVAAHMEPDILIVDEVLAVGDAEFQRKCIGKMKQVSSEKGRTILFVSHNMQAVTNLCSTAILLQQGRITATGDPSHVVTNYFSAFSKQTWKVEWQKDDAPGNEFISMISVELNPDLVDGNTHIDIRTPLTVKFRFYNHSDNIVLTAGLHLFTVAGECIFDVSLPPQVHRKGILEGTCSIPGNFLNDSSYYFSIIFVKDTSQQIFYFENCLQFEVEDFRENIAWHGKWMGYVRPAFPFTIVPVS